MSGKLTRRIRSIRLQLQRTLSTAQCAVDPGHLLVDELQIGLWLVRVDLVLVNSQGVIRTISSAREDELGTLERLRDPATKHASPKLRQINKAPGATAIIEFSVQNWPEQIRLTPDTPAVRSNLLDPCRVMLLTFDPNDRPALWDDWRVFKLCLQGRISTPNFRGWSAPKYQSANLRQIAKLIYDLGGIIVESGYASPAISATDVRSSFADLECNVAVRRFLARVLRRFDTWLRRYLERNIHSNVEVESLDVDAFTLLIRNPFLITYLWVLPSGDHRRRLLHIFSEDQLRVVRELERRVLASPLDRFVMPEDLREFVENHVIDSRQSLAGYAAETGISAYVEDLGIEPLVQQSRDEERANPGDPATQNRALFYKVLAECRRRYDPPAMHSVDDRVGML